MTSISGFKNTSEQISITAEYLTGSTYDKQVLLPTYIDISLSDPWRDKSNQKSIHQVLSKLSDVLGEQTRMLLSFQTMNSKVELRIHMP